MFIVKFYSILIAHIHAYNLFFNATLVRLPIYEIFQADCEENLGEERSTLRAVYRVVRQRLVPHTL